MYRGMRQPLTDTLHSYIVLLCVRLRERSCVDGVDSSLAPYFGDRVACHRPTYLRTHSHCCEREPQTQHSPVMYRHRLQEWRRTGSSYTLVQQLSLHTIPFPCWDNKTVTKAFKYFIAVRFLVNKFYMEIKGRTFLICSRSILSSLFLFT